MQNCKSFECKYIKFVFPAHNFSRINLAQEKQNELLAFLGYDIVVSSCCSPVYIFVIFFPVARASAYVEQHWAEACHVLVGVHHNSTLGLGTEMRVMITKKIVKYQPNNNDKDNKQLMPESTLTNTQENTAIRKK